VIGALVAPGEMLPVSKPPPFCVAVCATLSSLCQRTCCPTWTFAWLARRTYPPAFLDVDREEAGVGVGVGSEWASGWSGVGVACGGVASESEWASEWSGVGVGVASVLGGGSGRVAVGVALGLASE
jgi:hypothetical protein